MSLFCQSSVLFLSVFVLFCFGHLFSIVFVYSVCSLSSLVVLLLTVKLAYNFVNPLLDVEPEMAGDDDLNIQNVDIVSPDNPDDEVQPLPDHQFPFGIDSPLDRRFQAVLFHYDVDPQAALVLATKSIHTVKQIRYVNPDGGDNERALYDRIVVQGIPDDLQQYLVFARLSVCLSVFGCV